MTFADLLARASVFVDANTFVYHFEPHPTFGSACTDLIERIEKHEVQGFTSAHVLTETAHRLMTLEACARFEWPFTGIARRLRNHPAEVQTLTRFRQAIQEVPRYGIHVVGIDGQLPDAAASISQQAGVLSNDALVAACMRAHGSSNLASNDADFDHVPEITRYAPAQACSSGSLLTAGRPDAGNPPTEWPTFPHSHATGCSCVPSAQCTRFPDRFCALRTSMTSRECHLPLLSLSQVDPQLCGEDILKHGFV